MKIGIDIDNVISNFNDVLFQESMKHDKNLRNTGRTLGYIALLLLVGITQNLANLNIMFLMIVLSIVGVVLISNKTEIE